MSLPKGGKVNMKTPQNSGGLPKVAASSYSGPSNTPSKKIKGPLKANPAPGSAPKPKNSGAKFQSKIQTGNPGSRTGKK